MKRKVIRNTIRDFLEVNKVWFETIAAFLLGVMAIIISFLQYNLSEKENKLLEKQATLSEAQTRLTQEQLINSRITDSIQVEIAKKQDKYLEIQTDFLYTPDLKVELGNIFKNEYKIILKNEGQKDIEDIRIRVHFGLFMSYDKSFKLKVTSMVDWKNIPQMRSGEFSEILLDTSHIKNDLHTFEVEKQAAQKSIELNPGFQYSVLPIELFVIKFRSGPDKKEYTIKKYLYVTYDISNKNRLLCTNLDLLYVLDSERVKAIKSANVFAE